MAAQFGHLLVWEIDAHVKVEYFNLHKISLSFCLTALFACFKCYFTYKMLHSLNSFRSNFN